MSDQDTIWITYKKYLKKVYVSFLLILEAVSK